MYIYILNIIEDIGFDNNIKKTICTSKNKKELENIISKIESEYKIYLLELNKIKIYLDEKYSNNRIENNISKEEKKEMNLLYKKLENQFLKFNNFNISFFNEFCSFEIKKVNSI